MPRYVVTSGLADELARLNNVLNPGEMCIESDTGIIRFGDGSTPWVKLAATDTLTVGPTGPTGAASTVTGPSGASSTVTGPT